MSIEAMKQALEALEYCKHLAECQRVWGGTEWSYPFPWKRIFDSTTKSLHTIRAAIEQAEKQEPVAKKPCPACGGPLVECQHCEGEGYEPGTDNDVTGPALCRECGGLGGKRPPHPQRSLKT